MALALTVEKLDGLDPAIAGLYAEKDGKFFLQVDGLEDTSGLKSALEAERKARKDFEKKYGALKDVDPEEYARLKAEAADRETEKLTKAGDFEKLQELKAKEIEELKASFEKRDAEREALLNTHIKDAQVRNAALKAGVIPEDIEDVMIITGRFFKLDGGSVRVLDDKGEVTLKTVDEFFAKDFKERKPKFYAASGNSGGGTPPGGTPPGGSKTELQKLEDQYDAAVKARDNVRMVALKRQIHELKQAGG